MKLVGCMYFFGLVGSIGCVTTVPTPTPDIPATVAAVIEASSQSTLMLKVIQESGR